MIQPTSPWLYRKRFPVIGGFGRACSGLLDFYSPYVLIRRQGSNDDKLWDAEIDG